VRAMLDVEVALAEAEAGRPGSRSVARPHSRGGGIGGTRLAGLAREAALAGNLAIPLVQRLRTRVAG
jgi:hypothetical protein